MSLVYEFDSACFTLAGLSIGRPLLPEDVRRLQLTRVDTEVSLTGAGHIETSEDWSNDACLLVGTVDALTCFISTECLAIDGQDVQYWTEDDFLEQFGMPDRREQVTDTLSMLTWRRGAMAAFFFEEDFQDFYISEPDDEVATATA